MERDLKKVFEGVNWHQRWEIEPGVFTPGHNDIIEIMRVSAVPMNLSGRRVLDIGPWNGCCSFESERRGASEVVAIGPEDADHCGFNRLKQYLNSKVTYIRGSIYDLQPDKLGKFDVVLCFGVLYHLRHPLLGLDMVRRVAKSDLHLETYALEPEPKGGSSGEFNNSVPILRFYRRDELNRDPSNWFAPNRIALEEMVRSAGFDIRSVEQHIKYRISLHAQVNSALPEWMTIGSGEGAYYEVITRPVLGRSDVY